MSAAPSRAGRGTATPRAMRAPIARARLAGGLLVAAILFLAFVHSLPYAVLLPPWGLVDEEQHLDYVQRLAEWGRAPVAHRDLLSPEIAAGLFATNRWETLFHRPAPASALPEDLGLEAYSYEGYQPPLYYALLAPIYRALRDDIVTRLYALRLATVGLSLLTVYLTLRFARELFPRPTILPYAAALLVAVLPERAMAVSRVNNDALLEVLAVAFLWAAVRAHRFGLDVRRAMLLGTLYGLGVLAKLTMAALAPVLLYLLAVSRPRREALRGGIVMAACAALLIVPLVVRNLMVYGDLTGFSGFSRLMASVGGFRPPAQTIASLARALLQSVTHIWFVWWKGADVGGNALTAAAYALLLSVTGIAILGLARRAAAARRRGDALSSFMVLLFALPPLYALLAAGSYLRGEVPVVQGRFLLPALAPGALALVVGLWQFRQGAWMYAGAVSLLLAMTAALLLGNLLPHAYYWSAVVRGDVSHTAFDLSAIWTVLYPRLLADKPAALRPLLPLLLPCSVAGLVAVVAAGRYWLSVERHAEP